MEKLYTRREAAKRSLKNDGGHTENRGHISSCSVSVLLDRLNERRSQCQEKRK